jgi:hypothetical protein
MELIKQESGIDMPIRTVGEYLKRWGIYIAEAVKRAYEQNPKAVQRWLDEDYPVIKARAKKEKSEIYCGDETGLRNDSQHERGYAPKGKTPLVRLNAKRVSTNMISVVTNRGRYGSGYSKAPRTRREFDYINLSAQALFFVSQIHFFHF